jgi:hypothetical protein
MAKADKKQPWFKFYPSDWAGDRKLHMCSIAARGLWADLLCVMHEAEPYGHLVTDGHAVTNRQIAALAGIQMGECGKLMAELESAGVYSRTDEKVIYSRRMVRDKAKAEQDRTNGKGGGNPVLTGDDNGGVNPPIKGKDKAKKPKPSSRIQNPEPAAARELDENGLKQENALKALFVSIRSSLKWSIPNLDQIQIWLADGVPQGIISAAVTPMLKRKEGMASLSYCDSAVREAHAAVSHLQVITGASKVWVDEGTQEWSCHQAEAFRKTGRGTPVTDQRDEAGRPTGRRGWNFLSRWPEGFNDFGERIELPSEGEERVA